MNVKFYIVFFIFLWIPIASADVIVLNNGDQVTGQIIEQSSEKIVVQTEAMGQISIDPSFVARTISENKLSAASESQDSHEVSQKEVVWERNVSLGYNEVGGNTEKSQFSAGAFLNRKTGSNESTAKIDAYYSSSDGRMDGRKYDGLLRYAYSFGYDLNWYHFYKLEGNHDRFANIDYRLIPSTGVGYWFSDAEPWKLMTEIAIGFEHTNFRGMSDSSNEAILVPRLFLEKTLGDVLKLSQDLLLYPSLSETGEFRLRSETKLVNPITDKLSWSVSFLDDFNSDPTGSAKKNDYRLISGFDYSF